MDTLQEFKCPSCGGAITFDSTLQKMHCPYCDTEFEVEAMRAYDEAQTQGGGESVDWESVSDQMNTQTLSGEESAQLVSYVCESCAGEIVAQPTTGAFACPYCGNQIVSHQHFSGMVQPDFVIPFKLDKNTAKAAMAKHLKGKRFLPKIFTTKSNIDSIQGVYVPFWLFDCTAKANMRYKATKHKTWSDSSYNYTRTDYYMVKRGGQMSFSKVPVDSSTHLDDTYMQSLEPFDFREAQPFHAAYLAGYSAEKFDVSVKESRSQADKRINNSTNGTMRETVNSYDSVILEQSDIQIMSADVHYAMLPVWLVSTRYMDKIYTFAMNGQTGKFVGDLPVDWGLFWKRFALIFAIATVIGTIINFLV